MNEARDYLRATDAVSRPMAAVLSVLTIVILAIFFFIIFMLIRWGYNSIRGTDESSTVVVVQPVQDETPPAGADFGGSSDDGQQVFPGFVDEAEVNRIANGGSVQSGSAPAQTQTSVPVTGAATPAPISAIPNTGPSEE